MKKYTYSYPKPSVTTDCIVISEAGKGPHVLLIKRKHEPFSSKWALPGGFVEIDEDLHKGAARELEEETGIKDIQLQQFKSFGKPGRDPRGRTISIVFYAFIKTERVIQAGDDAAEVAWFDLMALPELAFDHEVILKEFTDFIRQR